MLEKSILKFLAAKTPPIQSSKDKDAFLALADESTLASTLYNMEKKGLVISGVRYGADNSFQISIDMIEITGYGLTTLSLF
ncbi:hypothetical protein [Enterobacter sp. PTB]|uniref:hypothetical protein n=1 Tax=Enterobacter TaxID=547 RepID=UPI003DA96627